jgi:HAD superfamily hydrolase (TIGR01509 family)
MLKAVVFDIDGTLAETEEFHRCAFNRAFAEHGVAVDWSANEYRELLKVTGGKERIAAYFRGQGRSVSQDQVHAMHRAKNAYYAQVLAAGSLPLRPGISRLLREARAAGLAVAIATTTSPENLDALLRPLLGEDWASGFASVVAGDQVARKKPAPDVYLAALAQLGIDASEAVAIEDSAAGLAAAHAAGVAVVATPSMYTAGDDLSDAEVVLPHLGDPENPWPADIPGFSRRWVQIADLQWLAAPKALPNASANEVAQ